MKKVNDQKIYRKKYYAWYYNDKLKVNLIPISWYTYEQARYTLLKQFGNQGIRELKIIPGSKAIDEGMELGKNVYWVNGKNYQVKKFYIPSEYNINKSTRRTYIKKLKRRNKINKPSGVNRLLKTYRLITYGTR